MLGKSTGKLSTSLELIHILCQFLRKKWGWNINLHDNLTEYSVKLSWQTVSQRPLKFRSYVLQFIFVRRKILEFSKS